MHPIYWLGSGINIKALDAGRRHSLAMPLAMRQPLGCLGPAAAVSPRSAQMEGKSRSKASAARDLKVACSCSSTLYAAAHSAGKGKRKSVQASGKGGGRGGGESGRGVRSTKRGASQKKDRSEPKSQRKKQVEQPPSITETARRLSDGDVADAISDFVPKRPSTVLALMR